MERIAKARPTEELRVRLTFSSGLSEEVDLELLMRGPVFEPLKEDRELFRAVRVDPQLGTIVWPNEADLDPDMLYSLASGTPIEEIMGDEAVPRD